MSIRHLAKGSVVPPFTGKLRVYSMRFCPYAQRTILVLNAKKIPYEVVNVNLTEKPEWLTSKSPLGKVPSLEIEENVIVYESLITADYLEDKYPTPQLVSSDPLTKALDKLVVENFSSVTTSFIKAILIKDQVNDEIISKFFGGLEDVQNTLVKRGTTFLYGSSPGMVDYMIWPWFERFELIDDPRFAIDKTKFKVLEAYAKAMRQDPAVKDHYLEPAVHAKYLASRLSGNTDYDFLL